MPRPDEGLIHAWLDGQLPPEEAARIEQLATTDPEWAAAVAEARGLVAASSRILAALDDVPANVVPNRTAATRARRLPWWTKAAAAVVLMSGGSVLVMQRLPDASAPSSAIPAPRPADVAKVPVAAEPPAATSAEARRDARRDARPTPTTVPQSTPAPVVLNEAKPEAPKSVAQDAPRAALAESQGKAAEAVAIPPVTPLASAMFTEKTKDAASDARPAARAVAGVAEAAGAVAGTRVSGSARMAQESKPVVCYRLTRNRAPVGIIGVMRTVRTDGDTLRLEPAQDPSLLRAWIVWRDGSWQGVAVPIPAGRDTIAVIATRVACPAP